MSQRVNQQRSTTRRSKHNHHHITRSVPKVGLCIVPLSLQGYVRSTPYLYVRRDLLHMVSYTSIPVSHHLMYKPVIFPLRHVARRLPSCDASTSYPYCRRLEESAVALPSLDPLYAFTHPAYSSPCISCSDPVQSMRFSASVLPNPTHSHTLPYHYAYPPYPRNAPFPVTTQMQSLHVARDAYRPVPCCAPAACQMPTRTKRKKSLPSIPITMSLLRRSTRRRIWKVRSNTSIRLSCSSISIVKPTWIWRWRSMGLTMRGLRR